MGTLLHARASDFCSRTNPRAWNGIRATRGVLAGVLLMAAVLFPRPSPAHAEDLPNATTTGQPTPIAYSSTKESDAADESLGKGETVLAGEREHDGFFLRMSLGPGAARTHYEERVDGTRVSDVATSGLAGIAEVAAGGRAVGNLIVHGNLMYSRYHSPTRTVDGVKDAAMDVSATALMLGAGASYYFMPYNVFLTAALGLAWQIESRSGGDVAGNTGFFVSLAAGKEWWVGDGNWGLGAALRGTFASGQVDVAGVRSTSRLGNLGLAFCATFN
jgi:hypothetical protein